MPYIGNSPGTGTRNRFIYTATASQTTFSGADDNGKTLKYADSDYVDVYLNGICLVPVTDYTSTSKTSIVLTQAASLNDTLEVVAYDIATISDTVSKADGGTFEDAVTVSGKLTVQNQVQAVDITNSTGNLNMNFTPNDSTGIAQVNFGPSTDKDKARIRYEVANDDLKLITNNTDRITIDTNGNVGIGTSSPDTKFHVSGGNARIAGTETSGSFIDINASNTGSDGVSLGVSYYGSGSYGPLKISTGGSERMRIDSNGSLLIGYTTYSASMANGTGIGLGGNGIVGYGQFVRNSGAALNIGRVVGTGKAIILSYGSTTTNAAEVGSISVTGSATSYNTSSDYRLKENVTNVTDGITRVKQLAPKRFNFIADPDTTVDGFLAHEAATVVPEAVTGTHNETEAVGNITDGEGNITQTSVIEPSELQEGHTWTETGTQPVYQGIDQAKLVPLLTAALQEAIAKIETLETKVAALEAG